MNRDVLNSLPMHQHGTTEIHNPYYTQGIRKLLEVLHAGSPCNPSHQLIKASWARTSLFNIPYKQPHS